MMGIKLLIDNALSPLVADKLREKGYDVVHVREINMQKASDREIFERAFKEDRVLISDDTDFSYLLYTWNKNKPSLILFRKGHHRPQDQIEILVKHLPEFKKEIEQASIIVFEKNRVRIRKLPLSDLSP